MARTRSRIWLARTRGRGKRRRGRPARGGAAVWAPAAMGAAPVPDPMGAPPSAFEPSDGGSAPSVAMPWPRLLGPSLLATFAWAHGIPLLPISTAGHGSPGEAPQLTLP